MQLGLQHRARMRAVRQVAGQDPSDEPLRDQISRVSQDGAPPGLQADHTLPVAARREVPKLLRLAQVSYEGPFAVDVLARGKRPLYECVVIGDLHDD